jgi:hypothetical protein
MGPWTIAALIAIATVSSDSGRTYAKKLIKAGVRLGLQAKDSAAELAEKANDYRNELVAEIREENSEKTESEKPVKKKTAAAKHAEID